MSERIAALEARIAALEARLAELEARGRSPYPQFKEPFAAIPVFAKEGIPLP